MLAFEHSIGGGPGIPSEIDGLRRFRTSHRLYAYAELVLSLPPWRQGLPRARHPDLQLRATPRRGTTDRTERGQAEVRRSPRPRLVAAALPRPFYAVANPQDDWDFSGTPTVPPVLPT